MTSINLFSKLFSKKRQLAYRDTVDCWVQRLSRSYRWSYANWHRGDSMTTPLELALLRSYAKDLYLGNGKIIDLGCWVGATTRSLAQGLLHNPHKQVPRIEAYDLFVWEDWMEDIKNSIGLKLKVCAGECFLSFVQQQVAPYSDLVTLHKEDLLRYQPPADWRIEFLFIDAMKNWDLARAIGQSFFPLLISEGSLIVQQDFGYFHPIVCTNHVMMWRLKDYFEFVHHVPNSCSVVFYTKKTPARESLQDFSANTFSEKDIEHAYEHCLPMVHKNLQVNLLVAKLSHHLLYRQKHGALSAIAALRDQSLTPSMKSTIEQALKFPCLTNSKEESFFMESVSSQIESFRYQ